MCLPDLALPSAAFDGQTTHFCLCVYARDLFIYQSKRECGRGKMYLMKKSGAWVWRKETDMPYFAFMTYISPHPRRLSHLHPRADAESRQLISLSLWWWWLQCLLHASSTLLHLRRQPNDDVIKCIKLFIHCADPGQI